MYKIILRNKTYIELLLIFLLFLGLFLNVNLEIFASNKTPTDNLRNNISYQILQIEKNITALNDLLSKLNSNNENQVSSNDKNETNFEDLENTSDTTSFISSNLPLITTFIGAAIGGVLTHIISPKINQSLKIRETYLIAYKEWIAEIYGNLHSLNLLLRYITKMKKQSNYENPLIEANIVLNLWKIDKNLRNSDKFWGKFIYNAKKIDMRFGKPKFLYFGDMLTLLITQLRASWDRIRITYPKLKLAGNEEDFLRSLNEIGDVNDIDYTIRVIYKNLQAMLMDSPLFTREHINDILYYLEKELP